MYCTNCGTFNESRARYCKNCGEPLESPVPEEVQEHTPEDNPAVEKTEGTEQSEQTPNRLSKKKWALFLAALAAIFLLFAATYLLLLRAGADASIENMNTPESTYSEHVNSEQQTNAAVTETEITETSQPETAEAYLEAADVHIRQQDFDGALSILQEGLEKTGGDEHIKDKLAHMKSGTIMDSSGNIRKRCCYDADGTVIWSQEFVYDDQDKLISAASYDVSGNQTGFVEMAYNEMGKPLTGYSYRSDTGEIRLSSEKTYDENGILTQVRNYRADTYFTLVYHYDSLGRMDVLEEYNADDQLEQILIYEYSSDDSELESGMKGCQPNGELIYYATYEYSEDGKRVQTNSYDADGNLNRITKNIYDSNGERIRIDTYDSSGNLTESAAI